MSAANAKPESTPVKPAESVTVAGYMRLQLQVKNLVEALREDYCASDEEIAALLEV